MNYFTSKTAEQLTLVSISHAREGKAGELKKACLDLIEKTRQEEGVVVGKSISRRVAISLHTVLNLFAVSIAFYLGFAVGVWKI